MKHLKTFETYTINEEIFGLSEKEKVEKEAKKRTKAEGVYKDKYTKTEQGDAKRNGIDIETYKKGMIDYLIVTGGVPGVAKWNPEKNKMVSAGDGSWSANPMG